MGGRLLNEHLKADGGICMLRKCSVLFIVFLFIILQQWSEDRTTACQPAAVETFFSPNGGCTEAIVNNIDQAKSAVLIQAYNFTSYAITRAVVQAKKRGVNVKIILDKSQWVKRRYTADLLAYMGINILIDDKHDSAQSNIIIIDSEVVITGSFHFTMSAEYDNAANLLILQSKKLATIYTESWNAHSKHSKRYSVK
jgi:phosphatidylserine/phosphatidylglycerophosphate/cardiolipin synthase-like enzyme